MGTGDGAATPDVIDELGIYLLPGRIKDPARALEEAVAAEAAGLSAAWLAERYDIKDAGVLCGAIAARTERIRVGMGSIAVGTRAPIMTAAMGATFQETFGNRLLLGMARGLDDVTVPQGLPRHTLKSFEDYCDVLLRLWNGETVDYDGPLGRISAGRLADPLTAPRPELLYSSWVPGPKGIALTARLFDGVILGSELTVNAVRTSVDALRQGCVDIGRDPASLRVYAIVITAPGFDADEELLVVNARVLTHLGFAGVGERIMRANGWDEGVMARLTGELEGADQKFHRHQLMEMAGGLPREWIEGGAVVGSPATCVARLREYLDAGLDEIILHGCAPDQVGGLLDAWRTTAKGAPA